MNKSKCYSKITFGLIKLRTEHIFCCLLLHSSFYVFSSISLLCFRFCLTKELNYVKISSVHVRKNYEPNILDLIKLLGGRMIRIINPSGSVTSLFAFRFVRFNQSIPLITTYVSMYVRVLFCVNLKNIK